MLNNTEDLIRQVFDEMVKAKPNLAHDIRYNDDGTINFPKLGNEMVENFPWPVGIELRRLFTKTSLGRDLLTHIFRTFERTLQFISFSEDLPMLQSRFQEIFKELQHWVSVSFHITTRVQTDYLNKSASTMVESAAYSLRNVFFSVTTILLWTIFIFLFTFFMLLYRKLLKKFVLHLFSEQHREKVGEIIVETKGMINGYIFALLLEMVLLSIVNCTMFLIMGIKYAMLLGVMAAVLNIIPYLGIYSSIVVSFLITFANSTGNMAIEVGIALFCVHLVDSNFLMPRLVGGRVKMNPFITILAVMVGEFIWGVPGMFLFIPITGILKLIFERVEGLQAWGILIGEDEKEVKVKKVKK